MDKVGHVTCAEVRRKGIECLVKCLWRPFCWKIRPVGCRRAFRRHFRSLRLSFCSPPCPAAFPRLLQRHPETSRYHPNINSWKNVEEKDKSTRRNGCFAIGRNRSGNTRISFRNLEGVREAVHLENMHLHGASASLHAPASSLTLQAFLLARKILAAMLAEFFPSPNCPETIRNATVCECVTLEETKLI